MRPPETWTSEDLTSGIPLRDAEGRRRTEGADAAQRRAAPRSVRNTLGHRAYWIRRLTLAGDVVALVAALGVAVGVTAILGRPHLSVGELILFAALIPFWVLLANLFGLYHLPERTADWTFADDVSSVIVVCSIWAWFWLIGRMAISDAAIAVLPSLAVWAAAIALVPSLRSGVRAYLRTVSWYRQSVLVVGSSVGVDRVLKRIDRHPDWCFDVVETIAADAGSNGSLETADVVAQARSHGVGRVVVVEWPFDIADRTRLIRDLLESGLYVDLVSSEPDVYGPTAFVNHLEGLPTLAFSPVQLSRSAKAIKRAIDVSCASVLLVGLSPLMAYIAARIKLDSQGPVLFRQDRSGTMGSRFKLIKFRTMSVDAEERLDEVSALKLHPDSATFKAAEDPRVTRYGASLRRRSLDELPQLWNVLTGDMSLVGPRPLPLDEAAAVPPRYRAREHVRPGLTGPWQVLGRSDIPFEDMIKLDYMYVNTWSPRGDLKLLLRTFGVVAHSRGAY